MLEREKWPTTRRRHGPFGRGARRGQSLTELALILPVLTLIMLGTIDLGRAFYDHVELTNAVKEGALYGARDPRNKGAIENRAYQETPRLKASGGDFIILVKCYPGMTGTSEVTCDAPAARAVEVSGTYVFRPITPMIRGLLPTNFKLRKSIRVGIL